MKNVMQLVNRIVRSNRKVWLSVFVSLLSFNAFSQQWLYFRPETFESWINIHDLDVSGNKITVEALVSVHDLNGTRHNIVSKHRGPVNCNYVFKAHRFEITTTKGYKTITNPMHLCQDTVYHVAATYDGDSMIFYVNGVEVASTPWSGDLFQNDFSTAIGNRELKLDEQFRGYLNEIRIWNVARTEKEIAKNMYNLPNPAEQKGLLAYYKFDSEYKNLQGNTAFDGMPTGRIPFWELKKNEFYKGTVSNHFCVHEEFIEDGGISVGNINMNLNIGGGNK